jgi:hypothetical protein
MAPDSRRISAMPGGRAHYAQLSTTLRRRGQNRPSGLFIYHYDKIGLHSVT